MDAIGEVPAGLRLQAGVYCSGTVLRSNLVAMSCSCAVKMLN